ncbi:MAG: M48 family metalloprotease [Pseudobdellovibrionaceae bacterium]
MRNPTKVSSSDFSIFPFSLSRVSLRVWLFLAVVAFLHLIMGYRLGGRMGLWIGFFAAASLVLLVYFYAQPPLLEKFRARRLSGQDAWNLQTIAAKYSRLAGVPVPDFYLMDSETAVAFSMGPSWRRAKICLSTALLKKLTDPEIEAVVVHQVCHVRRLETFSFSVSSALAHSLVGLATVMDWGWPANWTRHGLRQRPFLTLLAPLAGLIIRIAISDRNYFENDDLAASLISDRRVLANALWKIESYCQTQPLDIPPCTNHLFIVNPEGLRESNWFFVTHPKMESRLKRLAGTYPL